jgi:hypothetical protein
MLAIRRGDRGRHLRRDETHARGARFLSYARQSPQDTQAIIAQLRTGTKMERLSPYTAQHAIVTRGTAQIAAVDRLHKELGCHTAQVFPETKRG